LPRRRRRRRAGAATPAPPVVARPVESPGNAEWAKDAADARAKAAAQKKLVYYEFESAQCGDCRRMQALLYPAFDFEALLIGTVPVRLELDSADAKPLQQRYTITQAPTVLIATPEGRVAFLVQGFKDAPDFYSHARKDLDAYRKFAARVESADVAALSAGDAFALGRELYARSDPAAALAFLQRATVAPDPAPGVREAALEGLAATEMELGHTADARKAIDRVIATTKSPDQKERAELFRAQIPLAQNKPAEALALYKQFAKDHPSSKYLEQVRSLIARLETPPAAR
jgi:tetratricopeptide (TPR) repeat protein